MLQQHEHANRPRVDRNEDDDVADAAFLANNMVATAGAGSDFERVIIVRRRRRNREGWLLYHKSLMRKLIF